MGLKDKLSTSQAKAWLLRARSMADPSGDGVREEEEVQSRGWADLPDGLLEDVIRRVEADATIWPDRCDVVACAGVCRPWRTKTLELARRWTLDSARITFPDSLKLPGPRDETVWCRVVRDPEASTFTLHLDGVSNGYKPRVKFTSRLDLQSEESTKSDAGLQSNGKTLLVARKIRRKTATEFMISLAPNDFSRASSNFVGKIRSDFLGTKFTIFDSQSPHSASHGNVVATISYDIEGLGLKGPPRKIECVMHSIPTSTVKKCNTSQSATSSSHCIDEQFSALSFVKPKDPGVESREGEPLVLINKNPRWHENLLCWCLNFRGRVTVASGKNFQLMAYDNQFTGVPPPDNAPILLQFGKVSKYTFTMDYRYPLSAFHAFAICLSNFGTLRNSDSISNANKFAWSQYS